MDDDDTRRYINSVRINLILIFEKSAAKEPKFTVYTFFIGEGLDRFKTKMSNCRRDDEPNVVFEFE